MQYVSLSSFATFFSYLNKEKPAKLLWKITKINLIRQIKERRVEDIVRKSSELIGKVKTGI